MFLILKKCEWQQLKDISYQNFKKFITETNDNFTLSNFHKLIKFD